MSKVTVFVPTYNYGKYIEKCLDSILNQTRKVDQIIVVDDCSTDNTPKILKKYKNKILYIRNKKNIGNTAKTYNLGLKNSIGDYILFVSADDFLKPAIIEKEAAILDKHPQIGMVYAQSYTLKGGSKYLAIGQNKETKSYIEREKDFELLITKGNFIPYHTALFRKKAYKKVGGFNENFFLMADYDFWLRISNSYPLAYIAKPLAFYRLHENNYHLSLDRIILQNTEWLEIINNLLPVNNKEKSDLRKKTLYYFYVGASVGFAIKKNLVKTFANWKKAIFLKPDYLLKWSTWQPLYFLLKNTIKFNSN